MMKLLLCITVFSCVLGCSTVTEAPDFSDLPELKDVKYVPLYHVRDELDIRLDNDPEFHFEVTIGDDGYIDLPRVGAVKARGKSRTDLRLLIETKLVENGMYKEPRAVVNFVGSQQPPNIVVVGAVNRARIIPYQMDMGLGDAIGQAGGLLGAIGFARPLLIVRNASEKPLVFQFDVEAAMESVDSETGLGGASWPRLLPGDIIISQGSAYSDLEKVVNLARNLTYATANPISTFRDIDAITE